MNEHPAAWQPMTGVDRHPANLPGLIVEQEVLDRADLAVGRLDLGAFKTTHSEQHGLSLLMPRSVGGASRRRNNNLRC